MSTQDRKKTAAATKNGRGIQAKQLSSLPTRSRAVGAVRIVGGKYKRTPLPVDDRSGLRPTPERVRETVFDWLTHLLGGLTGCAVCDMFAGSGAMGLESVSRGAATAVILEKDRKSAAAIARVVEKLGAQSEARVVCTDAFAWLEANSRAIEPVRFDVVFIDPPFALRMHAKAAQAALPNLKPEGLLYMENDAQIEDVDLDAWGLTAVRRGRAGAVWYLLAQRKEQA
ncbi:MAG: 16S rRNA (guanine(966)-N(2))-methyltransferase RsmD [Duodenibacillus sp.]|nr:16S rRNA (guanine(966)-N(2))-methyltransferase RsmD [Duodenibacillus sp.]